MFAAGRPVVATAFPHAVELLGSGAGLVVPQRAGVDQPFAGLDQVRAGPGAPDLGGVDLEDPLVGVAPEDPEAALVVAQGRRKMVVDEVLQPLGLLQHHGHRHVRLDDVRGRDRIENGERERPLVEAREVAALQTRVLGQVHLCPPAQLARLCHHRTQVAG